MEKKESEDLFRRQTFLSQDSCPPQLISAHVTKNYVNDKQESDDDNRWWMLDACLSISDGTNYVTFMHDLYDPSQRTKKNIEYLEKSIMEVETIIFVATQYSTYLKKVQNELRQELET